MSACKFLNLLVALLLLQSFSSYVEASVEKTCKVVVVNPGDYEFCVSSLQAVPESKSASPQGLAAIAANLTMANATSTLAKIQKLLQTATDPGSKDCLEAASITYSNAISTMRWAVDAVLAKDYVGAEGVASANSGGMVNVDCDSKLSKERENFSGLSKMSMFIARSLK